MTQLQNFNTTTHWILQGKGGVGKSLSASVLTQYLIERGYAPACGDTDPVNSTFHQIKDLNVELVNIAENGVIIQKLFDPLFESILLSDTVSVIDNGASTFLPFAQFIKANGILEAMEQYGKQVFIHCIVTGGQSKDDTAAGLLSLIELVKSSGTSAKIVVWINEFWGVPSFEGKTLEQTKWFGQAAAHVQGVVHIIQRTGDDFITDVRLMTERHLTYRQIKLSEEFRILSKSRIYNVFNDIYRQLDDVFTCEQVIAHE